ncbi:hypothetical protein MferCBS31731_005827 [Microsporum ferrugineum]
MAETLRSILCGRMWNVDSHDGIWIEFKDDGTGEMAYYGELNVFIAAEIEWGTIDPTALDQVIHRGEEKETRLLAEFDINLTLTKRRLTSIGPYYTDGATINGGRLEDNAFILRTFHVRLEKGSFIPITNICDGKVYQFTKRYALRLAFDKTPFPPSAVWKRGWQPWTRDPGIDDWTALYVEPIELVTDMEIWNWYKDSYEAKRQKAERLERVNGTDNPTDSAKSD